MKCQICNDVEGFEFARIDDRVRWVCGPHSTNKLKIESRRFDGKWFEHEALEFIGSSLDVKIKDACAYMAKTPSVIQVFVRHDVKVTR